MAKKTKPKSTKPASSWWKERSKIAAKTTASKPAKPKAKKAKAKKASKAEKGEMYYCEVCGSEVVCVEDSAGSIVCCEEPMCLVC
ncbi:MAG: hypothetical protein O8C67_11515 [Candidatus Methanoperedens sp.]|nr:hypothetical protein [Candidatus Methanoperedens sp.]MCZ7405537.1 hypothetical protein [Candidatus Methanoperedens sp.]